MTAQPDYKTARFWIPRLGRAFIGLVILLLGYAGLFAITGSSVDYPLEGAATPGTMKQVHGAYHVHSTRSDGRASPEEIAHAAKVAGLQFVIITDHNDAEVLPAKYVENVLLIFGTELSTPAGHLVALGLQTPLTKEQREGDVFAELKKQDAASILAHPIQPKRPWTDWTNAPKANGLELYSADSMFRDAQAHWFSRFIPALGAYTSNPTHAFMIVTHEDSEATQKLLELSSSTPKLALCAADAHGLPSYTREFATLSTVLPVPAPLPEDPKEAAKLVLENVRTGATYCAFQALGAADGFAIDGFSPERTVRVGDLLKVKLPNPAPKNVRVEVRGNGELLGPLVVKANAPGAVEIQVWAETPGRLVGHDWKPWIVSSAIRVVAQ
ncbi:MAG: PHP domain-containing protein [Myxococcaceae bacterium]